VSVEPGHEKARLLLALNELWASEATGADIEHLGLERVFVTGDDPVPS
jgi:hypothetical protein